MGRSAPTATEVGDRRAATDAGELALSECVFCAIAEAFDRDTMPTLGRVAAWSDAVAFKPLNPVTPGHVLVIPRDHVPDAAASPHHTALTARHAAELARGMGPCNIITSIGAAATQTVFHLHLHVVPRRPRDGLQLPWSGQ